MSIKIWILREQRTRGKKKTITEERVSEKSMVLLFSVKIIYEISE